MKKNEYLICIRELESLKKVNRLIIDYEDNTRIHGFFYNNNTKEMYCEFHMNKEDKTVIID